jgi:hypothetical protein
MTSSTQFRQFSRWIFASAVALGLAQAASGARADDDRESRMVHLRSELDESIVAYYGAGPGDAAFVDAHEQRVVPLIHGVKREWRVYSGGLPVANIPALDNLGALFVIYSRTKPSVTPTGNGKMIFVDIEDPKWGQTFVRFTNRSKTTISQIAAQSPKGKIMKLLKDGKDLAPNSSMVVYFLDRGEYELRVITGDDKWLVRPGPMTFGGGMELVIADPPSKANAKASAKKKSGKAGTDGKGKPTDTAAETAAVDPSSLSAQVGGSSPKYPVKTLQTKVTACAKKTLRVATSKCDAITDPDIRAECTKHVPASWGEAGTVIDCLDFF